MLKKILLKIYKTYFAKKYTPEEIFELNLRKNKLISNFEKDNNNYLAESSYGKTIIRGNKHSDFAVFRQIFNDQEYKTVLSLFKLNKFKTENLVLIDAGANVGYTSLYFLQNIPNLKVFGIEPSESNMSIYKQNISLNNFEKQLTFYPNALAETENKSFSIDNTFRDGKDWAIATKESEKGEIKGVTISEIIKSNNLNNISILKIDIEGAERFIFNTANDLSFLAITQIIAIEIHDEFDIRNDINNILKENNFILFETGELTVGVNKSLIK